MRRCLSSFALLALALATRGQAAEPGAPAGQEILWKLDNLERIGGHPVTILGQPRVVDSPLGKAVAFAGERDALVINANPLAGLAQFTAEAVFRPAPGGQREQRFVHCQERGSENRLLFEIRLPGEDRWFLDSFIKSGEGNYTQLAERFPHPLGPWQHAAIVVDGQSMRHFVNGQLEMTTAIRFTPFQAGTTSLGARLNQVSWYRGEILELRVTPRALAPANFHNPPSLKSAPSP